jgi:hypothetical protein
MALAYFYNRKAAIPYEMERTPDDFNRRVVKNHGARAAYSRASGPGREANISEGHALIKNSTLIFLDKCGHLPWLEQPKETWKIVNEFLARLPYMHYHSLGILPVSTSGCRSVTNTVSSIRTPPIPRCLSTNDQFTQLR